MLGNISPMSTPEGYTYTIHSAGDSDMMRVAAELASETEAIVPYHGADLPAPMRIRNSGATNSLTVFVVLGATLFVAKHLTGKFLDDVYIQFQPRVKAFLEKVDSKLSGGNRAAKKIFNVSVWYEEYQVLVSVSVAGTTYDDVAKQMPLVNDVHRNALVWIAVHGIQKPVHHYHIEDGKVSPTPVLLDRFQATIN